MYRNRVEVEITHCIPAMERTAEKAATPPTLHKRKGSAMLGHKDEHLVIGADVFTRQLNGYFYSADNRTIVSVLPHLH